MFKTWTIIPGVLLILVACVQHYQMKEQQHTFEAYIVEMTQYTTELMDLITTTEDEVEDLRQQNQRLKQQLHNLTNENHELLQNVDALQGKLADIQQESPVGYHITKIMEGFNTTWYNYNSGATATGVPPVDGVTVAVDPSVIPLGSWVKLVFPDGTSYVRKAQDTGGAVKGKILDIYAQTSTTELLRRGRTHGVKVYLLERMDVNEVS